LNHLVFKGFGANWGSVRKYAVLGLPLRSHGQFLLDAGVVRYRRSLSTFWLKFLSPS
jgi:hypothetical protein